MKVIGVSVIASFSAKHSDARDWLQNWLVDVKAANWNTPQQVKERYPSASILRNNTFIFNVRGNNYRLVTQIAFQMGVVAVKWIGSHAEYDKLYS